MAWTLSWSWSLGPGVAVTPIAGEAGCEDLGALRAGDEAAVVAVEVVAVEEVAVVVVAEVVVAVVVVVEVAVAAAAVLVDDTELPISSHSRFHVANVPCNAG